MKVLNLLIVIFSSLAVASTISTAFEAKSNEKNDNFSPGEVEGKDSESMSQDVDYSSTKVIDDDEENISNNEDYDENNGVPYEETTTTVEPELSQEMKEKLFGIPMDICNTLDDPKKPLHISHPTNCEKFYKCYNGRAYLNDCAPNTHFSVHYNRCDYVRVAKCKPDGKYHIKATKKAVPVQASAIVHETKVDEKPETGDYEIDPRCDGSDPTRPLHIKHPNDCSKFYKCYMGRAYVIKCPRGQHWATHLNRCEHTALARCIQPSRPGIRPAQMIVEEDDDDDDDDSDSDEDYDYDYPTYKPDNIIDDADYKIKDQRCLDKPKDLFHPIQFAHPSDCSVFYKCIDGFGYKVRCPATLHYHAEHNECDYQDVAKCKMVDVAEAGIVEASDEEVLKCVKGFNTNIPIDGSFTSYFECVDGIPYLTQCSDHELFNPVLLKCERVTITDEELITQILILTNSNQKPSVTSPNFVDPHYNRPITTTSKPQIMSRPIYPQQMPQIQYPNNYPGMMNNQNWINPSYPLWHQQPNWQMLIPGMNFPIYANNPLESSDESSLVTFEKPAHNKPGIKIEEFNFEIGRFHPRCPEHDDAMNPTHLSHEKECSKFYKCFEGRAFLMECPEMQEWSEKLQRCDFHENAECDPIQLFQNTNLI